MVWSNLPNQGVTAGTIQHRGVGRISVQGCQTSPQNVLLKWFWMWQGRECDEQTPLQRASPTKPYLKISTQYCRILKESWFFTPLWHNCPPRPLCYLSCEWPIISGEKWGENSFFRRIRKCQGSLPRCGCYTPVIAFCYCKGFSRRDCLLSCASALRCIFTTRTDLASLYFPEFYDNKNAT